MEMHLEQGRIMLSVISDHNCVTEKEMQPLQLHVVTSHIRGFCERQSLK